MTTKTITEPHVVTAGNAALIWKWLHERGGLAIWESINLANPGATWTTPVRNEDGLTLSKPNWQCGNEPARIITDPAEVNVTEPIEVKRFHIAVRLGSQGLSLKVTSGSSERIRKAVAKYSTNGRTAFYELDRSSQECVIYIDSKVTPLADWVAKNVP